MAMIVILREGRLGSDETNRRLSDRVPAGAIDGAGRERQW
jgi:hypothetical protein